MILQILEYGDINVIEETLMEYYFGGISSKGLIHQFRNGDIPLSDIILPYYNFFRWTIKKFGLKFFITNFDKFFLMCIGGIISNIREIFLK